MQHSFVPSRDEFCRLAREGNVIPVYCDLVADSETPVSVFSRFDSGPASFLFESTEKNDVSGRFSFVGVNARALIRSQNNRVTVSDAAGERTVDAARGPVAALREVMAAYRFVKRRELPRFVGGAVGFVAYDAIRFFEPAVSLPPEGGTSLPEMMFLVTGTVVIFDHRLRTLRILSNGFVSGEGDAGQAYDGARREIDGVLERLLTPPRLSHVPAARAAVTLPRQELTGRTEFEQAVSRAKEHILDGDIFQIVLSRRSEVDYPNDPLTLYRCLRFVNPSPYMFCLNFGAELSLVGSSPEMHVRVENGIVEIRPIAGTRWRGATAAEDERLAAELLADPKERAEHVMLLDLARNDLGRVAEFGSVKVTETMEIERYSHVMHIVSHVMARLRGDCDACDVLEATFPAGTVSGAPKIRAMQLISELEQVRRGCYAGAVGYLGFDGNLDSCITLRSIVLRGEKAWVQAGAGIVADSDPAREYDETENKAAAMLQALGMALAAGDERAGENSKEIFPAEAAGAGRGSV